MEYAALNGIVWAKGTFWVTIAVLIFLAFFGRKIVHGIVAMLDQRSATIRRELDEAARLRGEAEAMLKDAEARRETALAQAREMLALAGREAERLAAELLTEAEAAAKRREQMAHERITAAQNAAIAEVREAAAALASRVAEKILSETIDQPRGAPLIDQAIARLPASLRNQAA